MSYYKEKLIKRIEEEFDLEIIDVSSFVSNHLSRADRSSGFTCWNAETLSVTIGSHDTIKDCATAKKLSGGMSLGTFIITVEEQ